MAARQPKRRTRNWQAVYTELLRASAEYYSKYLNETLSVELPDAQIQQAYDWSRISMLQGVVNSPFLGTGLVAGYRTSGESQRPGSPGTLAATPCGLRSRLTPRAIRHHAYCAAIHQQISARRRKDTARNRASRDVSFRGSRIFLTVMRPPTPLRSTSSP